MTDPSQPPPNLPPSRPPLNQPMPNEPMPHQPGSNSPGLNGPGPNQPPPNQPPLDRPGPGQAGLNQPPPAEPHPTVSGSPAPGFDERGRLRSSKVSGIWVGLIGTALFLILLVIFIAQNSRKVSLHFLGWHGQFSLALTILLSAVIGVLLVAIPGSVRIIQLRRALRKNGPGKP